MKLFPCLTIATLCAAFAGCTATTQTISFVPETPAQDGISVSIDGAPIGVVPVAYEAPRTKEPASYTVVFSKDGYVSEEMTLESYPDVDGRCSFLDSFPIPELVPAPVADEPVAEVADEPVVVEEPAPEPVADEFVADEPVVAVPEEEPEVVEEPAPDPADEPAVEETPEEPVTETPEVTPAEEAEETPALEPSRTLKDIEAELKTLSEQRKNGSLSEADFQKKIAELEKEVQTRYAK